MHAKVGQAPLEGFRQDPAPATRPADPEKLRQAFLHRAERKVRKTATISFKGNRYIVPAYLRGKPVELRYDPFDLTRIATKDLYPSRGHQEVQGRLNFALQERFPALVTGDVGTGKSTALRAFAQSLDRNVYRVVYLSNPHLTVPSLYRQILVGLQAEPAFGFRRLLPQFHTIVSDLARKRRYVLLIVDEAHLLPAELFDQLRFLLNQKMDSSSSITLVLLGQPDLAHKLRFAPYEALYQRIAVRYQLPAFDLEETAGYIKHHLRVAGFQGSLFSDGFVSGVYNHTRGVARRINNTCRGALLLGASEHKQILDEMDLKRVILDLEGPNA